jgi:hypothetical protein
MRCIALHIIYCYLTWAPQIPYKHVRKEEEKKERKGRIQKENLEKWGVL